MRGCFFKYRSDCRIFHDPCVANGSRGIVPKKFFLAYNPIVVYNCFINFRGKIMVKQLTKTEKVLFALLGLSVAIIVLGILFLLNAMQDMENPDNIAFFTAFSQIDNVLAKYIVVILTMSAGIMLFCGVEIPKQETPQRTYYRNYDVCICAHSSARVRVYRNLAACGKSHYDGYAGV